MNSEDEKTLSREQWIHMLWHRMIVLSLWSFLNQKLFMYTIQEQSSFFKNEFYFKLDYRTD